MTFRSNKKVVELGCKGHLIVARKCQWSRHTQVGDKYRVSTIGDYIADGKRKTIGGGINDFFETMVFETTDSFMPGNEDCGCHDVVDWMGLDFQRYTTAGEAQAGHEAMIKRYRKKL